MICVIATIRLNEGCRDEFLAVFQELVPKVLAEQGCIEYAPMVDVPTELPGQAPAEDHVVTVVEKWSSLEALERHLLAPHMVAFRERTKALRCGVALRILTPAEPSGHCTA